MRKDAAIEHIASIYIPWDWRQALAQNATLPEQTSGAALFADVSGFTPLTEALTRTLGHRRGAEELTRQLNRVYDALIVQVDQYGGSVLSFAGDAITCWFAEEMPYRVIAAPTVRATACALAMQQAMRQFAAVAIPAGETITLAVKVAIASGSARRFLVGDPTIQLIDALAGKTLARMAAAEHMASSGEVVLDAPTATQLGESGQVSVWRTVQETGERFAVVGRLLDDVELAPWPPLAPGALHEEQIRSWLLPPVYARLSAGLGEFMTELRPALTLFMRFEGIDYDEDQAAGLKLDAYIRWVQGVLARHEGVLLQLIFGDKGSSLYAAFGAPAAHEDDARRAVSAALELRAPPADLGFIHQVQIGISQGTMRTGAYGGTTRRTYGVLGDEVNLAARLMQRAAPGEVLVSGHVQRAVGEAFDWEALPAVQVKGKSAPIPVSRLVGKRQMLPAALRLVGAPSDVSVLIGREAELAQLKQILERALAGEGQILRLEGETGVGKSHLAVHFALEAASRGAQVCIGECQSTSQYISYFPWRPVFNSLLGLADEPPTSEDPTRTRLVAQVEAVIDQVNPDWRIRLPLLGDLLGLPIPDNATTAAFDPRLRQEALFALAVELVEAFARNQPLSLLIEDANWMDEASQGLTLALGRIIAKWPVLLMLVHRPPMGEDKPLLPDLNRLPNYHQLDLNELESDEIAALVTYRLGVPPSPGIGEPRAEVSTLAVSLIRARARGNPFFTEELVDALRETGNLVCQDGVWTLSDSLVNALREANCLTKDPTSGEWQLCSDARLSAVSLDIPETIHGAVLSRLDRLPELHKLTLKVASVIGRVFELDVLARANPAKPGMEALQAQLEALEKRDFTRRVTPPPHAAYMFQHNLTQEVIYDTLLGAQQRELHRAVGTVLETWQPEAVEQLAYHFGRGGVRFKTLFYLDKAARKAQRNYANETALNYYSQALTLEELGEWRKGQIEVLHILGRREEEQATLCALESSPDASAYEIPHLWGQYYEAVSDYAQAQAAVERALTAGRERADRVREANSLAQLGLIARRQGDYERAKDWYQQALVLFQEDAAYSPEEAAAFAQTFNGLGMAHHNQGNYDEARACYEQALRLSRQSGNRKGEAEALNSLGGIALYQRNFPEALVHHRQALEIRRSIGDRAGEGISLYNLAIAISEMGDYGKAQEYFLATLAIQQAIGNRWEESNACNGLGILYFMLGDLAKAEAFSRQGLQLSQEIGDEAGQAYALGNLGQVMRDRGDIEVAEKLLADGLVLVQKQEDKYQTAYLLSHLGLVSLYAGKFEQAIERANLALNMRREIGLQVWTTADLAILAAAHLALQDVTKALEYAGQAITMLDECEGEGPEFPQQDYFICYQVLQAGGQTEAAYNALQLAYRLVMARAEKITDPALHQSFLERVPLNRQIVQEAIRLGIITSAL